ncbi:phosphoglycerate kinase [Coxiella endosymbiont of Amblyomma nuttalli]|uniref:phosphoglycerate kinase n=1 Tax=Coxiella endosymbiont of Amblyomma nuttalli TaxID=2749996 RepID=UPI001BAAD1F5|nr:phosphoglycerate kinase [Coxiella endosymbiont of Amblyomma nuttalli]
MKFLTMSDMNLMHRRVLIREDLNVPMEAGKIMNDEKIVRALPTIEQALEAQARVIVLSHLGRPEEGKYDAAFSLMPVAEVLSKKLNRPVPRVKNWLDGVNIEPGSVVLCENVRFNRGENENDHELAKQMAKLCDVFVMDAFATAHRCQASTVGAAQYAPIACAGPLLIAEIKALSQALKNPKKPLVVIVGGSKVSTKIQLLEHLLDKIDQLVIGGGIANTFLKAQGYAIGKSFYENTWLETAKQFWKKAKEKNVSVSLPIDVVLAKDALKDIKLRVTSIGAITEHESIFDVGPKTRNGYTKLTSQAGTIVWNGPVGVFEIPAFSHGTYALAKAIAKSEKTYSIAGGGDTLAALDKFDLTDQLSYISTAGGAFLEFLKGKLLPAIEILIERAKYHEQK